jgi:Cupin domain/Carboxypeptidase regulatory-like domain
MRKALVPAALLIMAVCAVPLGAQRRGAGGGRVTFTVFVQDPSGAPISETRVTVTGPADRSARTERGRLAFEDLPAGDYRFRFERAGYLTLERDVTGRGAAPIEVKVTMTPLPDPQPQPPALITTVGPLRSGGDGKLVVLDLPAFIEKNYVGRAGGKMTPLACSTGGNSVLMQINEPVGEHTHADADEFIYVVAGQGTARFGERQEPLSAGVFMLIPRGAAHAFTATKKPLVLVSTRAGEQCSG